MEELSELDQYKEFIDCGRNTKKFAEKFEISQRTAQRYQNNFLEIDKKIQRKWLDSFNFEEDTKQVAEVMIENKRKATFLVSKLLGLLNDKVEHLSSSLDQSLIDTDEIVKILNALGKYAVEPNDGGGGEKDIIAEFFRTIQTNGGRPGGVQQEIQEATCLQLSDSSVSDVDGGVSAGKTD